MRVALTLPVPLVKKYGPLSEYHLMLAHLALKYPAYRDFYTSASRNGETVILDNSVAEREQVSLDNLLGVYGEVLPRWIIARDMMGAWTWTKHGVSELLGRVPHEKILPVLHGRSTYEFMACFGSIYEYIHEFKTYAIPKACRTYEHRSFLVRALREVEPQAKIHLLGLCSTCNEIQEFKPGEVMGVDMKRPIWLGLQGISLSHDDPPKEDLNGKLDMEGDADSDVVEWNIQTVLRWGEEVG